MMLQFILRKAPTNRYVRPFSSLLRSDTYINGKWVNRSDTFDVMDPGNGTIIASLPDMTANDCTKAIDAACAAQNNWKNLLAKERSQMLRDIFLLHLEHQDELADILAMESGKPFAEAKGEIMYGASFFEWFAEEAKRMYGHSIPEPLPGRKIITFREPVGVTGLITPWNFPNAMIARKLAPAMAAGCTSVIKPSPDTPLSTLAIAKMAEQVGVPSGVINVVTSSNDRTPEIGSTLTGDVRVRKISFTGSTGVGSLLLKESAASIKKVSMELGGNASFIVFDDADLDLAADNFMTAKFRNCGQTCVSANRIFVQNGVYEEFSQKIAARIDKLKVGWYKDDGVSIGPLINKEGIEKVASLVEDAVMLRARAIVGGQRLEDLGPNFYAPTVLTNCTPNMQVATKEIFGPVAALFKFETEEEVIERANNTESGLASYFFSRDISRCFRISQSIECGMVGVNTGIISTEVAPFGGVKQSGLGREGSMHGLEDYTELKTVTFEHG